MVRADPGVDEITSGMPTQKPAPTESLLAQIVDACGDAIMSGDAEGIISSWNPAAERLFGYSAAEMIGNNAWQLIPPELRDLQRERMARMQQGETISQYETVRMHKSGARITVSVSLYPLRDQKGRVTGAAAIVRDLSAEKNMEQRLHVLEAENAHFARLSEIGQMSAAIAHELNQPLAAVTNYLAAARRLAAGGGEITAISHAVDKASSQAHRAGKIIRFLRDFLEKRETRPSKQDLNAVIRDAVALGAIGSDGKDVQLTFDLTPNLPLIMIDAVQIQQVLVNLVRNAVEAMAGCPRRALRVLSSLDGDQARIVIADTGPGLPADVREKLFQAFITTKPRGMGIGLSICRSIIEAHAGSIRLLKSEQGTSFEIRLPLNDSIGHK